MDPYSGGEHYNLNNLLIGFFAQDDLRLQSNLTLNLGLRYEFITVPSGKPGTAALRDLWRDKENTVGPTFLNPSLKNFAPRLGLAWNPRGDQKTTIRVGAGIFHDQLLSRLIRTTPPPFVMTGQLVNPTLPVSSTQLQPGTTPIIRNTIFYNFKQPTRLRFSLTLLRELPGQTVVSVGYTGAQGWHQIRLVDEWNTAIPQILPDGRKFFAPNSPRRRPEFGNIRIRFPDNNNFYHSLVMSLNKRFSGVAFFFLSSVVSSFLRKWRQQLRGSTATGGFIS